MNLGSILVSGEDAEKCLQGQLTCDMSQVKEVPLLAAHCNVKGRVVSLFRIHREAEAFVLELPEDLLPIAFNHLQTYTRLFKKVALKIQADNLLPVSEDWRLAQIRNKIPVIYAATSGLFLPHDLNLLALGAVSLTKGCYLGQEIIARMENLGKPKQHLHFVSFETSRLPFPGETVAFSHEPQKEAGWIVDAIQPAFSNQFEALVVLKDALMISNDSLILFG